MSQGAKSLPVNVRQVVDQWAETLVQVLESMTDQRPQIAWQEVGDAQEQFAAEGLDYLWWEQPIQAAEDAAVRIATPGATWDYAGSLTLKAAGLETIEASEAKSTWFEILGQSLSALARSIGVLLGREVTSGTGVERAPTDKSTDWLSVTITFTEKPLPPLLFSFNSALLNAVTAPPVEEKRHVDPPPPPPMSARGEMALRSRTIDLLLDVDLPVSISFGKTRLAMKDVLKLTTGSIVELDRNVNDPVEVLVNHRLIARGEVVVVEGNYGVKIQEIASRLDRLRSLP